MSRSVIAFAVVCVTAACAHHTAVPAQYIAVLRVVNKTAESVSVWLSEGARETRLGDVDRGKSGEFGLAEHFFVERDSVNFHAFVGRQVCATHAPFKAGRHAHVEFVVRQSPSGPDTDSTCVVAPK